MDKIFKWIEIVLLGFGAWMAWAALHEYRAQAKISVINRLDDADAKIYQMQLERPDVASLYSDLDRNLPLRSQAEKYLAMAAGCDFANSNCPSKNGPIPQWKTIPELECAIWEARSFNTVTTRKLREGMIFAESILYLVARAYERKVDKSIDATEYENWAAYIKDYGHHPLLLSAVRNGMTHGYISEAFSDELKRLLNSQNSKRAAKMIEAIYPELEKEVPRSLSGANGC